MLNKRVAAVLFAATMAVFFLVSLAPARVSAWSNGGYSGASANLGYGTHDWIAQHALDLLPPAERRFLADNLVSYLYGTELPDNGQTPGGVGDTTKHHVYFYVDGSLQDDVAAVRASAEFVSARQAYEAGNFSGAAVHLGMVAHYVADVAVFGHVMGAATAWGAETHHGDYEGYVLGRTENYTDDFNVFLVFDGNLTVTSAYDAALAVACDTTFSANGNCNWMDLHYNWSDPAFRNRAGESLNLAANAVADVLHGFYSESVILEFPSDVAFAVLAVCVVVFAVCVRKKGFAKTHF